MFCKEGFRFVSKEGRIMENKIIRKEDKIIVQNILSVGLFCVPAAFAY